LVIFLDRGVRLDAGV